MDVGQWLLTYSSRALESLSTDGRFESRLAFSFFYSPFMFRLTIEMVVFTQRGCHAIGMAQK